MDDTTGEAASSRYNRCDPVNMTADAPELSSFKSTTDVLTRKLRVSSATSPPTKVAMPADVCCREAHHAYKRATEVVDTPLMRTVGQAAVENSPMAEPSSA